MRAVYRTSFQISGEAPGLQRAEAVAGHCWLWISRKLGKPELALIGLKAHPHSVLGDNATIEASIVQDQRRTAWGLRFVHEDRDDVALIWSTELTLVLNDGDELHFACSLSVGRKDGSLAPFKRYPSRPRIVSEIVEKFKCVSPFQLSAKALPIKNGQSESDNFFRLLYEPRRRHPVVYLSCDSNNLLPLDPHKLANHLAGLAYVVFPADQLIAADIATKITPLFSAFNGAIRLYWPGFSRNDDPFSHPLWTQQRVLTYQQWNDAGFGRKLLGEISVVAASSIHKEFLTWERLQELERNRAISEAQNSKDDRELLALYSKDKEDLNNQLRNRETELSEKSRALYQAQAQIEQLKTALKNAKSASHEDVVDFSLINTVSDAMEEAFSRYSTKLIYQGIGKSEGPDSPFQPAAEAFRALEWLATVYFDAKVGQKSCSDFDANISQKISGWHYSGHQKESVMKANEEWYACYYQGKKIWLKEHLKCGRSTDANETIRIAFAWDDRHRKIVVGYIGQHQKNTQTN